MTVPMSPAEQVLSRLSLQKWAVDTRDAELLLSLYTADCEQVNYRGGPDGRQEVARARGRDNVVGVVVGSWQRTAATWYPGSMIHQIGSCATEPAGEGRIRCRSYASFLALTEADDAVLKGYGTYDDIWALDAGEWRMAYRECVTYGVPPRR
jgi:hypothetical protein